MLEHGTNVQQGEVKKINMVLVFENACARAGNIFLLQIFYQLKNIHLSLKDRVCEKYATKSEFFVETKVEIVTTS